MYNIMYLEGIPENVKNLSTRTNPLIKMIPSPNLYIKVSHNRNSNNKSEIEENNLVNLYCVDAIPQVHGTKSFNTFLISHFSIMLIQEFEVYGSEASCFEYMAVSLILCDDLL